jgi:hypothetical protein
LTEEVQRSQVRTRQVKRSVLDDDGSQILRPGEDDLNCGDSVNPRSRRILRWRVPVFPSVPTAMVEFTIYLPISSFGGQTGIKVYKAESMGIAVATAR